MEFFDFISPNILLFTISAIVGIILAIRELRQNKEAEEIRDRNYRSEIKELIQKREKIEYSEIEKLPEQLFWKKMEKFSKQSRGSYKNLLGLLKDDLLKMKESEIVAFYAFYLSVISRTNTSKLLSAFQIVNFAEIFPNYQIFADWLVSKGEVAFNNAVNNPDLIRNFDLQGLENLMIEDYIVEAYALKSNKLMPEITGFEIDDVEGEEMELKDAADAFPGLWEKYVFIQE